MIIRTQVCRAKDCKKKFRARKNHELCRVHHRLKFKTARPIESRELSENKYRRCRSRRRTAKKVEVVKKGKK